MEGMLGQGGWTAQAPGHGNRGQIQAVKARGGCAKPCGAGIVPRRACPAGLLLQESKRRLD